MKWKKEKETDPVWSQICSSLLHYFSLWGCLRLKLIWALRSGHGAHPSWLCEVFHGKPWLSSYKTIFKKPSWKDQANSLFPCYLKMRLLKKKKKKKWDCFLLILKNIASIYEIMCVREDKNVVGKHPKFSLVLEPVRFLFLLSHQTGQRTWANAWSFKMFLKWLIWAGVWKSWHDAPRNEDKAGCLLSTSGSAS